MWALRNRVSFTPLALDCFVANSLQFDPTGHLLAARQMG